MLCPRPFKPLALTVSMSPPSTVPHDTQLSHVYPTHPVWLLNSPIITADGLFHSRTLSLDEARAIVHECGFVSAVGHAQTAAVLSRLLGINCPVNRIEFRQQAGEQAIVLRLSRRLQEGQVLHSPDEIERIGYDFRLITRLR